LALAHNQLTSFSEEFSSLPRLRYLNLRSNFLKEFPLPVRTPLSSFLGVCGTDVTIAHQIAVPRDTGCEPESIALAASRLWQADVAKGMQLYTHTLCVLWLT
jgi:hypothetical protein